MTPEQFAYWLQGFVELNGGKQPTPAQWKSIKEHIAEVFTKVTPPVGEQPHPRTKTDAKSLEELLKSIEPRVTCSHDVRYC